MASLDFAKWDSCMFAIDILDSLLRSVGKIIGVFNVSCYRYYDQKPNASISPVALAFKAFVPRRIEFRPFENRGSPREAAAIG